MGSSSEIEQDIVLKKKPKTALQAVTFQECGCCLGESSHGSFPAEGSQVSPRIAMTGNSQSWQLHILRQWQAGGVQLQYSCALLQAMHHPSMSQPSPKLWG